MLGLILPVATLFFLGSVKIVVFVFLTSSRRFPKSLYFPCVLYFMPGANAARVFFPDVGHFLSSAPSGRLRPPLGNPSTPACLW